MSSEHWGEEGVEWTEQSWREVTSFREEAWVEYAERMQVFRGFSLF
jgi:hypothetical protein